jgi:hypothetical protein
MTWKSSDDGNILSVTARPDADETTVSVVVDRRGTFVLVGVVSSLAMFGAGLFSVFALAPDSPALGVGGLVVSFGGVVAAARGFWASSTRKVRERMASMLEGIGRAVR